MARRYRKKKTDISSIIPLIALLIFLLNYEKFLAFNQMSLTEWLWLMKGPISILFVIMLLVAGFKIYVTQKRVHKLRISGINQIDKMKGHEFEKYLEVYFSDMGYKVELIGGSGDGGADLILTSTEGKKICVQAKRWNNNVGFKAVQEVHTAKALYQCQEAWVVTNNQKFTKQAREAAKSLQVDLWDRERLIENMYVYNKNKEDTQVKEQQEEQTFVALYDSNVFHDLNCENGRNIAAKDNKLVFQSLEEAVRSGKRKCNCYK